MPPLRYFASFFCLHDLRHEAAHRLCSFILLLPCGVGVGSQGKACIVVPQHTADGFDVHPILQCQRCEGVSEVVKSDVRQPGVLQDLLVQIYDRVWVVHLTSYRRGEHVGILGMLAVFRYYFFENHLYLQRCVFANVSLTIAAQKLNTSTRFTYGILLKIPVAVPTHDRPACGRGRRVFAAAAPAACGRFERRWQREPGRCPGRYCPCGRAAGWRPVGRKAAPVRRAPLTFIAGLLERRSLQFFSNCQVFLLFYKK